jgi:uncharacterized protein YjiS (DUF1127 family)
LEEIMAYTVSISRPFLYEQQGRSPKDIALAALHRVVTSIAIWRKRAALRGDLACLDSRMIEDIGLSQEQFLAEIHKPFWKA